MLSSGAAKTAPGGRVSFVVDGASSSGEYKVVLPPMPTGTTCLNSVLLHCDLKEELKRIAVLSDIVALGAFQMIHVWLATLRTSEAKERLVSSKELVVKNLRCVIIDPSTTEVRVRLHWVPFHVHDDAVRRLLEPYGKVIEVGREIWRVDGFQGIESTTRFVRMTPKSGLAPDDMPHQLRLHGANTLIVIPGRVPVCLRCKRAGHIRRECRVPKCSQCFRFGHDKEECMKTYAGVTEVQAREEHTAFTMDTEEPRKPRVVWGSTPHRRRGDKRDKSAPNILEPASGPPASDPTSPGAPRPPRPVLRRPKRLRAPRRHGRDHRLNQARPRGYAPEDRHDAQP
ncbi:hypothetical protein HPB47_018914 [Ixodes persulcatus]|uniref:Uncharacterized protein n=1 Tax=Ixodes persulcatus TaxID=34615 RepID=A0AC60QJJ0_IXOPE|nr:hypothetical protein HPB47_018914 [Ixodes persulcatus]